MSRDPPEQLAGPQAELSVGPAHGGITAARNIGIAVTDAIPPLESGAGPDYTEHDPATGDAADALLLARLLAVWRAPMSPPAAL